MLNDVGCMFYDVGCILMKLYIGCMTLEIFRMIMDDVTCRLYWMVLHVVGCMLK